MCGIAGLIDLRGRPVQPEWLEAMCEALSHRGPDGQGIYHNGPVALGHRRLSIIDLASGHQPMGNEDGTVWVTFNGEIYNFPALRARLEEHGHQFATHSDTETIIHAYEEYGSGCVNHLRGMFAFAIWDARRQRLFAARDRIGKKPFYYTLSSNSQFIFSSELCALLRHPDVCRELAPRAIDDYLTYGYIPAPGSVFSGIHKILPGHHLTLELSEDGIKGNGPKVERYWSLEYGPKSKVDEHEAAYLLLENLTEAVRLRMVADVPLGALLSGGIDSGLLVALMSTLSDRPIKTFSIGFDERAYNELPHARLVAQRYGTEHHELIVRPDALDMLPALVRHHGEPFADSSAIPSYHVARLTRQHVTVALNGDGGDESFAGYERYLADRLADRYRSLPTSIRRRIIEPLTALIPSGLPRSHRLAQALRLVRMAHEERASSYLRWVSYLTPALKDVLYTPEFRASLEGHDARMWLFSLMEERIDQGANRLDGLLGLDVESYLPGDLLTKMDTATMACSLEARSPFLDHEFMQFAARLPTNLKIRGVTLKALLRRVAEPLLPRQLLFKRKMGFGVPVGDWMRRELRPLLEDSLLAEDSPVARYFRPGPLAKLVREHVEGREDRTYPLWAIFWLSLWHREFLPS